MIDRDTVHNCLKGIQFPADAEAVGERAMDNSDSCPSEIVAELRQLPSQLYRSETEVATKAGRPSPSS
jgi:Protein of unknown function (DUF2795)